MSGNLFHRPKTCLNRLKNASRRLQKVFGSFGNVFEMFAGRRQYWKMAFYNLRNLSKQSWNDFKILWRIFNFKQPFSIMHNLLQHNIKWFYNIVNHCCIYSSNLRKPWEASEQAETNPASFGNDFLLFGNRVLAWKIGRVPKNSIHLSHYGARLHCRDGNGRHGAVLIHAPMAIWQEKQDCWRLFLQSCLFS